MVESGADTVQITFDGGRKYSVYPGDIFWSPDSRYVAFIREDWRKVRDLWLIDHYSNPRPTLQTYSWPMPGENVEQFECWIFDTWQNRLLRVETTNAPDQTIDQFTWSMDSKKLYFQRTGRNWMDLALCEVNPLTGNCRSLIEEHGKRQVISRLPYYLLESTGEIIWWSWRDGWNHYYLYDKEGNLKTQITKGDFNAGKLIHVDEGTRVMYFMGNARESGTNPYYHHLYRIGLDGKEILLLTPENAEHEIFFHLPGDILWTIIPGLIWLRKRWSV